MTFDERDKKNLGRPFYFDLDHYLKAVEQMIMADELITALEMLNNVPSWYRANPPEKIHEMRKAVYRQITTIFDYAKEADEIVITDRMNDIINFPRGPLVLHFVRSLNQKGITPNIYDFGPASFWLAFALKKDNCKFFYKPYTIHNKSQEKAQEMGLISSSMDGNANIFMCLEVIEHLFCPKDLVHWYYHDGIQFDYAIVSTPQHVLGGGREDWKTRELGHVRTFTKYEFLDLLTKNIQEIVWRYYDDHMQIACGAKTNIGDFESAIVICDQISKEIDKQLGYY
jgi:hypothetical protein